MALLVSKNKTAKSTAVSSVRKLEKKQSSMITPGLERMWESCAMESTSTTCKRRRTLVSFSCPVFRPVAKALRQHGQAVSGAIQRGRTGRAEPLQHLQLHRLRPARAPEVHFCPFHQHRSNEPINDGHGPSDSSRAVDWFFCFVAPFGFESTLKATLVEGSEGIQRCPNHQEQERSERPAVDPRTVHVLRCDHSEAIYETADASQQRVHNQVVPVSFIATSAFLLLLLPNPTKALG